MGVSAVNANQSKYLLATPERNIEVVVHESEKLTKRTINVEYVDCPSNVVEPSLVLDINKLRRDWTTVFSLEYMIRVMLRHYDELVAESSWLLAAYHKSKTLRHDCYIALCVNSLFSQDRRNWTAKC